jgi:hypothetical protein
VGERKLQRELQSQLNTKKHRRNKMKKEQRIIQEQREELVKNLKTLDLLAEEISAMDVTRDSVEAIEMLMELDRKLQKQTFFPALV